MAAMTQTITALPDAPNRGVDAQAVFVSKGEALFDALILETTELNTFGTQANSLRTEVNASRDTVVAKEALVSPHYTAIDSVYANIADINAVNDTIVPNIAEILLADTNAATASAAATVAIAAANYKGDWVSGYQTTGYSLGMSVSFTDGLNYVSKINNNLATPVTKTNTAEWNWIEAIDPSTVYTKTESNNTFLGLAGGTMTGAITAIRETRVAMGANDIALNAGNVFTKTISTTTTLTVSSVLAAGNSNGFILELTNGGAAAVTWFSGVKWAGGTAPTLTAAGVDILGFYSHDGGTTWRGLVMAKDSK